MPIYEYLCAHCGTEFELIRPAAKADDPAPCRSCGEPGQRQLSTFSYKTETYGAVRLPPAREKPLRPHHGETPNAPSGAAPPA